jgi:RND family efflux transporter MFP subunit
MLVDFHYVPAKGWRPIMVCLKKSMGVLALVVLLLPAPNLMAADLPFATTKVSLETKSLQRQFEGTVEAVNKATISAQTSGQVTHINFDVDDFVQKDAIIVRFNDAEHKSRLNQAISALDAANARAEAAKREFDRVKPLFKSGTVARARFDSATSGLSTTKADVERAVAAVEQAREQLSYTIVRAPFSGLVVDRHVQIGETASPGKPLMTGFSLEALRVRAEVPEQYARQIRKSNRATVLAGNDEPINVNKLTVFPFADPKSNTVTIRLELPPGTTSVFPGMLVKARFKIGEVETLLMPAKAIVARGEVRGAYLVGNENNVHLQQIRTGKVFDNGDVEILSGLKQGDRVALDPLRAAIYRKQIAGDDK